MNRQEALLVVRTESQLILVTPVERWSAMGVWVSVLGTVQSLFIGEYPTELLDCDL